MAEKWWDGVNSLEFDIESIDYRKYLNCPACKDLELYCSEHRKEVEMIIASKSRKKPNLNQIKIKIKKQGNKRNTTTWYDNGVILA